MAGGESVRHRCEHSFVQTVRDQVLALLAEGGSVAEVALELGIAPNTVRYHRSRPEAATAARPSPAPAAAVREVGTRAAVERLLRDGLPRAEIARRLGIGKATVSYHARRLGHTVDRRCARRYDWAAVRRYYEAGHSVDQCIAVFGFSRYTWHAAVRRGDVVPRPAALAPADLFAARTPRSRANLKRRLLADGLKAAHCERCGIADWLGEPLALCLHHLNGDRHDNRLENLRLLCPNCHSQTENFSGRNRRAAA
jgi:DNA-binding CsgD family transcriptional regulator